MTALTRPEVRFILSAVCIDEFRPHISEAHACLVAGMLWVCATDGKRLHAVRAPAGVEPGYVMITKDGALGKSARADRFPPVDQVWQPHLDLTALPVDLERLRACASGTHDKCLVKLDRQEGSQTPYPWLSSDPCADSQVLLDARYVRDALLAVPGGKKPPTAIRVAREGALDPVMLCEDAPLPSWRAIIMPVRSAK